MFRNLWLALCLLATASFAADNPKYQYQTDQLFQSIPTDFTPSQYSDGKPYDWRGIGATATHVDRGTGWVWKHVGGDWLDKNGVEQGSNPWINFPANSATGTNEYRYSVDVTELEQHVQRTGTWNAVLLKSSSSIYRIIAGVKHAAAPVINVVYEDDTTQPLAGLYSAKMTTSTTYSLSNSPTHTLPAVLEFEKPKKPVKSATLLLTVTSHSIGRANIVGNLVNPPINNNPLQLGVAANYDLDENITEHPSIIGAQRYVDGTTRSDFIASNGLNIYAERDFSPDIWNRGPQDLTKLPHRDLGKFIAAKDNLQLVDSKYQGEGFQPLVPGLGALKLSMPLDKTVTNDSVVGYSGTGASIAKIFMPDQYFGRLQTIYVRYYMRYGTDLDASFSKRYEVRQGPTSPHVWTDMGGKIGITPAHDTTYGGVSGSAGGGYGHQMRLLWSLRNDLLGKPTASSIVMGVHTYDYGINNPIGHRYGDGKLPHMLGAEGGIGGIFFPGQWYLIEMKETLNTVMPEAPGYLADGSVEVWVDGRLALSMNNMVMRSLPLVKKDYKEGYIRPARELGIRDLWFNVFHGGKTKATVPLTVFVTGLAYGKEYIGPMMQRTQLRPIIQ